MNSFFHYKFLVKLTLNAFLIFFVIGFSSVIAQCPMCRMSAESNMANGGNAGQGLNSGILYLLAFPYLIAMIMIYLYRKNRNKLEQG